MDKIKRSFNLTSRVRPPKALFKSNMSIKSFTKGIKKQVTAKKLCESTQGQTNFSTPKPSILDIRNDIKKHTLRVYKPMFKDYMIRCGIKPRLRQIDLDKVKKLKMLQDI